MHGNRKSKRSLSAVFVIMMLLLCYFASIFSGIVAPMEPNTLYDLGTHTRDLNMSHVLEFVLDVIAYSL